MVVFSSANPLGPRTIALAFNGEDLTTLVLGIAVLLISWAMDEGRRIKEEQERYI